MKNRIVSIGIALCTAFGMLTGVIGSTVSAVDTTEKLRVMPLGDSITDGYWLTGGYRNTLCDLLLENGYSENIDFVGPNWGGNGFDPQHAGYSGYSIDNIPQADSISGQRTGISSFIDWLMEEYPADVVMLQIGTNDILSNYDLDNIGVRLSNLVDTILTYLPEDGMLYLATIPCMDANDTLYINEYYFTVDSMDACVDAYNSTIKQIVAEKQADGENIMLADINSQLTKAHLYDGVHPNEAGYKLMGTYWYGLLTDYIKESETPSESTTETTTPVQIMLGDVNLDDEISVSDLILLKKYILAGQFLSEEQKKPADANSDGKINSLDVAYISYKLITAS